VLSKMAGISVLYPGLPFLIARGELLPAKALHNKYKGEKFLSLHISI
jgi:hypothetical protein